LRGDLFLQLNLQGLRGVRRRDCLRTWGVGSIDFRGSSATGDNCCANGPCSSLPQRVPESR
jgi:hypothetical protein